MSTTILTLDEFKAARSYIDHIHEGCIDELASLEGDNWGCPVEGTEERRAILKKLCDLGFPFLDNLDKLIELKEKQV
jgi:hypothetical protein